MTQSQDPEAFQEHETFVKSVELMHKVYHCESSEQAVHVFREEVLGEDDLLESVLGCLYGHMIVIAGLSGTHVCHLLDNIIQKSSAPWN